MLTIPRAASEMGESRLALRLLIIDDIPEDAELILASLRRAGYAISFDVIQFPSDLVRLLRHTEYDLVISDHNLATWTGLDALDILRQSGKDIPFIVVTGTLGDEAAVEYLKRGAADYVLKHRLNLLPLAASQTLQNQAQRRETLRLSEAILTAKREWELTFDTVPDAVLVLDRDCRVHRANRAATELLQLSFSRLIGRPCREIFQTLAEDPMNCLHERLLATGSPQHIEESILGKTFDVTCTPLHDRDGSLFGSIQVMRDITERKRAELILRESEEKYRELVENATYGIFRSTPEGALLDANPALRNMLGYDSKVELLKLNLGQDVYENRCDYSLALREFGSRERVSGIEANWKRKDMKTIAIRLSGRAIREENGRITHLDLVAEDLSQTRSLEDQFRHAQKMEAVGRLAGGLAHDFNNLLGVIIGYSDLALESSPADPSLLQRVEEIKRAGLRAAALTRQLLAFSRKQVMKPKVLRLNAIVRDCSKMLSPLLGEDIQVIIKTATMADFVKVDPIQFEQVIVNLAINARDAMPDGGELLLETSNVCINPEFMREQPLELQSNEYVMLAVTDSGMGMDQKTQSRLFEPFFTTKEIGKGTGLGLATVYGIVKQSGGYISVKSELGQGTTFSICLPRAEAVVHELQYVETVVPSPGSVIVLLVEDEDCLRELSRRLLESIGYTVITASNGTRALEIIERQAEPIQLLMTDLVMPGMSGRELADFVHVTQPQIKVLYMSGYPDDVLIQHAAFEPAISFLQKPFTRAILAEKLRQILGNAQNGTAGSAGSCTKI